MFRHFRYEPVTQQKPPKPHLRLHTGIRPYYEGGVQVGGQRWWSVSVDLYSASQPHNATWATAQWETSKLALDACYYQFPGTWPAGRP